MKINLSSKKTFYVKNLIIEDDYATISGDKTIIEASLMMKDKEIPDLVVLDKENKVLGVIADHDIVISAVANGKDPKSTKVIEAMYRIDPVDLNTPVEVAFQRMQQLKVTLVPVVDNGSLKGVVTITDCWGYIPDKYEDYKGFLAVKDPQFDNYWFTILFTVLYFFFGIVSPIVGFVGFLKSTLNISGSINPPVTFYLFDAHGGGYLINYLDFGSKNLILTIISLYSIVYVFLGLVTTIAVIQWAYGDYKMIKHKQPLPKNAYIVGLVNSGILWLLFLVAYLTGIARTGSVSFDYFGLLLALFALLCLTIGVFRDFAFKSAQEVSH